MSRARLASTIAGLLFSATAAAGGDADVPRPTDLVERSESRLAQLEITVVAAPGIAGTLAAEDFRLKVDHKRIQKFTLDRHCPDPRAAAPTEPRYGPGSYMLYFDQPQLTMAGRARAIDLARELVATVVGEGAEAMIVSSAQRLAVLHPPSRDVAALLESLDRLEGDRSQWDFFAEQEDERIGEIVDLLNDDDDVYRSIAAARAHQREEQLVTDRSWRRLSLLVARLAERPSPRAVLYFADTIRSNPGEHYLTFFGQRLRQSSPALGGIATDALSGGLSYDRVINEASAHGVSLYSVLARGLVTPLEVTAPTPGAMSRTLTVPASSRTRFRDAQKTMTSLAAETGGQAFVRGDPAKLIAARLRESSACVYVASFDPAGFPLDSPLAVLVEPRRSGVELRVRGRIVLQSDRARLASRLLAAFSLEGGDTTDLELRTNVIPTGFGDDGWRVLLQIEVPATSLPASTWDLGASLLSRDQVRDEVSGRVALSRPGIVVVLEHELTLRPGVNEIVAVAHETTSDFVVSNRLRVDWPEPDLRHAVGTPIALVQPVPGAFLREGQTRTQGSLARAESESIDGALPAALMSLVCRSPRQRGFVLVERALVGIATVDFPPLEFDLGDDLCAQVRDVIPGRTLAPGDYSYQVRVAQGGAAVHHAERGFRVAQIQR